MAQLLSGLVKGPTRHKESFLGRFSAFGLGSMLFIFQMIPFGLFSVLFLATCPASFPFLALGRRHPIGLGPRRAFNWRCLRAHHDHECGWQHLDGELHAFQAGGCTATVQQPREPQQRCEGGRRGHSAAAGGGGVAQEPEAADRERHGGDRPVHRGQGRPATEMASRISVDQDKNRRSNSNYG